MKNYYYILGIKPTSTTDDIKKAYRKLSTKFHPDKNEGDEFFVERFKEIQEAYETLINASKRQLYDAQIFNDTTLKNRGTNFNPHVEYFRTNKKTFEYDEEITFSWKTINSDKVILKPFGKVQPIGQATYKIKDFKHSLVTFELIAENSNINREAKSSLSLINKTYQNLEEHFRNKFREERHKNTYREPSQKQTIVPDDIIKEDKTYSKVIFWCIIFLVILFFIILGR